MAVRLVSVSYQILYTTFLTAAILASAETNDKDIETFDKVGDSAVNTNTLVTEQASPRLFTEDTNVNNRQSSLNSESETEDMSQALVPVERMSSGQNVFSLLHRETKANDRRFSLGVPVNNNDRKFSLDVPVNNNDELQRRLLDLNMWFPCGKFDRCRVGRNYCSVDTNRCEICNSDVCHGSNADSMCNFMCKEIPSPEGSSTASSVTTQSPVTITTEGCPTASTKESTWTVIAIIFIVLTVVIIPVAVIVVKKFYVRKNFATITTDPEETSVKETRNRTERGQPVTRQESHDRSSTELAVSTAPAVP